MERYITALSYHVPSETVHIFLDITIYVFLYITASEEAQILPVESLSAKQQNMLAVMDSLNMCMLENDWEYTPEDPAFLWTALFYTIGNYPNIRDNESTGAIKIDSYEGIMTVYYKLIQ